MNSRAYSSGSILTCTLNMFLLIQQPGSCSFCGRVRMGMHARLPLCTHVRVLPVAKVVHTCAPPPGAPAAAHTRAVLCSAALMAGRVQLSHAICALTPLLLHRHPLLNARAATWRSSTAFPRPAPGSASTKLTSALPHRCPGAPSRSTPPGHSSRHRVEHARDVPGAFCAVYRLKQRLHVTHLPLNKSPHAGLV